MDKHTRQIPEDSGKKQDFNDYELVQDEYLKSLTVTDNLERMYLPGMNDRQNDTQTVHYSQEQRDIKIDRLSKL